VPLVRRKGTGDDVSSQPKNACFWCGKDATFLSTCEGCCLPCGDKMQVMSKYDLVVALTKAAVEVKRLEAEVERLQPKVTPGPDDPMRRACSIEDVIE
jgi:hypothetical protein